MADKTLADLWAAQERPPQPEPRITKTADSVERWLAASVKHLNQVADAAEFCRELEYVAQITGPENRARILREHAERRYLAEQRRTHPRCNGCMRNEHPHGKGVVCGEDRMYGGTCHCEEGER